MPILNQAAIEGSSNAPGAYWLVALRRLPGTEYAVWNLVSTGRMQKLLPLWGKTASQGRVVLHPKAGSLLSPGLRVSCRSLSHTVANAEAPTLTPPTSSDFPSKSEVKLNALFWSKPTSLALPPNSPLRTEDPRFEGLKHIIFKLLLFYSKQSKSIRGANVVYRRIISQVDEPAIYDVFHLEKTFKTTFSLLVLHMWLFLRRLKEDGKEGVEFGQYLYEIYNHDLELRVSKAGVNLLLTKWMKELEKIFYGNIVAYDAAMGPDAKPDDLSKVVWRNIFSDDGSDMPIDVASNAVQALSRYTRRESTCLSLTEKEAIYSGNFIFTPLESYMANHQKDTR